MKVAVIGLNRALGKICSKPLQTRHESASIPHITTFDVTDLASLQVLKEQMPDAIIDTCCFPQKLTLAKMILRKTFLVNAVGPKTLVGVSKQIGAITVFISTDFVFSGTKGMPYTEKDIPEPVNNLWDI
jgi:dTDP-4-dehydrorhamnose reductase